jgi:cation diffusion facilitator CzcD-associated flavoprotein CzcO
MSLQQRSSQQGTPRRTRVAIVGTGFSGLGMAIKLKRAGIRDFVVLERAGDIGGTWRDNVYPGCQCDVPSHLYSFSFALNPEWSRTYSTQPEIWEYLRGCADAGGVRDHVHLGTEVLGISWDETASSWQIETSRGAWTADYVVSGHGGLAEPAMPALEGLDDFEGTVVHSAAWDQELDLEGKRVAVVGTGASAIQIVPNIQPKVRSLTLFQRTPPWVLPHTDRPISDRERALYRRLPLAQKAVRFGIYMAREMLVVGMAKNPRLLEPLRRVAKWHLRKQVPDRALRKKLTPSYLPGCKRLLLSNDYYPALVQPNTEVVTDGIAAITPRGIVTKDGSEHAVDVIIFATGFRVTDNPMLERVRGREGQSLKEAWASGGMNAYLGTTVLGFPNLFLMTGPNTGIGHTSLLVMIEAQIGYVLRCLRYMDRRGAVAIEPRPYVVARYNAALARKMPGTVWTMGGCSSWYLDAEGRNTTLWPDFTWRYRRLLRKFEPTDYIIETERERKDERVSA